MTENFQLLVDKLKNKTLAKQAIWIKTSRDNEFRLELSKGAITTDNWVDENDGRSLVDLLIFNDNGDIIDRVVYSSEKDNDYGTLVELHSLAKKAYYKVDETLKGILEELDSDKTLGSEKTDPPLDF